MYSVLNPRAELKSGETVEIGVILCPDAEHADAIKPFLEHKGGHWNWHIERALAEDLDGLQTRFYVAKLDGRVIANVMTLEYAHCGILGHVFTHPDHRRKGAISRVFDAVMPDLERRGGVWVLGTGFESHPYWIYHGRGFRSITGDSGFMKYATAPDYEARLFAPGNASARELRWPDWPRIAVMGSRREGWRLRSLALGHFGPTNFEGYFLGLKREVDAGDAQAAVLETPQNSVAGYARLAPDARWKGGVWLLDFDVHPRFEAQAGKLLDALEWPDAKVQCYAEADAAGKIAALESRGFEREAALKGQLRLRGETMDVLVFARGA